jgi:hypothetical protein
MNMAEMQGECPKEGWHTSYRNVVRNCVSVMPGLYNTSSFLFSTTTISPTSHIISISP